MIRGNTPVGGMKSRGAALLALVLVVVLATIAFLISDLAVNDPKRVSQREANRRLAEAREALIGHATTQWCSGSGNSAFDYLPCPAGVGGIAAASPSCAGTLATGRVPWATLGIGPLKDNEGECFWLTRDDSASAPARLATVFAPGTALPGQVRNQASGNQCSSGTANNFIESANSNDISLSIEESDIPKPAACRPAPTPCSSDGQSLAANANGQNNNCRLPPPPGNQVSPACQTLVNQIVANNCNCSSQAQAFIQPPCINSLNSPQCQSAITALNACGP